ncbi:MAG TPA: nitroreductase family deazaflavin-dependent oxidoreductase [Actinobacteria bacterium]|nr:nitroreductase family deazaflavin-dependent oxidoreductase [Actinomycetota bacterium]
MGSETTDGELRWRGRRPGGFLRRLLRAPAWVFGIGLGRFLRGRFVVVVHRGRRSGRRYETPLEVVGRRGDELFVVSAWGRRADWVRNLEAGGLEEVWDGRRRFPATWRFPDVDEREEILAEYERRHRRAAGVFFRRLDPDYDVTDRARRRLAEGVVMVGFRPRSEGRDRSV